MAPTTWDGVSAAVAERHAAAAIIVPPRSTAVPSETVETAPTQRVGDGLRSRTDERRAAEVNVAVHALNRMLDLGRPISVRVA